MQTAVNTPLAPLIDRGEDAARGDLEALREAALAHEPLHAAKSDSAAADQLKRGLKEKPPLGAT